MSTLRDSPAGITREAGRPAGAGSLIAFFVLTVAMTWACFVTVARTGGLGAEAPPRLWAQPLFYLGVFSPAIVALALTARALGRAGVRALLAGLARFPADGRWYVFALGYMAAVKLVAALVHRVALGVWPAFGFESLALMLLVIPISTLVQAGEEIGWRGYALPRLAARLGLGPASIVLGVIWAAWHLPLFYMPGTDTLGQSFVAYLVQVTAISVAIGWLYWRTGSSLIMVMLMHAAINNTKDIVPTVLRAPTNPFGPNASFIAWAGAGVLWAGAAWFLLRMRGAKLA